MSAQRPRSRETKHIPLFAIVFTDGLRSLKADAVASIAESMDRVGQIVPITVNLDYKADNPDEVLPPGSISKYYVISGRHRLAAAKQLGWETIECFVDYDADELQAELWEIDENLCRAELTDAESAFHLARRKEIYEAQHGPAKAAGARAANAAMGRGDATAKLAVASFVSDTVSKTGRPERSVYRDVARGEVLGDSLKDIIGTPLDKGVELDALVKLDPEQRAEVIDKVKRGEIKSARQYEVAGPSGIDRDLKLEAARNMASWLAKHSDASQWEWIKSTLYTAGAKAIADAFVNETGAGVPVMDRRFG